MTDAGRVEATVVALFHDLETAAVRHALLRNYEAFPRFHHDVDLVMDSRDIPKWRKIAIAAANREGWDVLTECDHFALSPIREHNIEVFRFYRISPPGYLQVDLFHGFLVWGLPLFNETALLENRERLQNQPFTTIDRVIENLFRLLQIEKLAGHRRGLDKAEKYRDRVLQFCGSREESLRRAVREAFGQTGLRALTHLQNGDMSAFGKAMRRGKLRFVLRHTAKHPFRAIKTLVARLKDQSRIRRTRQCGFVLRICAPDIALQKRLFDTLDALVQSNVLHEWTADAAWEPKTPGLERDVMLRCGLVVKWGKAREDTVLDLGSIASDDDLATQIMEHLIDRHRVLSRREATA